MERLFQQLKSGNDPVAGFFDAHVDVEDRVIGDMESVDDVFLGNTNYLARTRQRGMDLPAFERAMEAKGVNPILAKTAEHRDKMVYRRRPVAAELEARARATLDGLMDAHPLPLRANVGVLLSLSRVLRKGGWRLLKWANGQRF